MCCRLWLLRCFLLWLFTRFLLLSSYQCTCHSLLNPTRFNFILRMLPYHIHIQRSPQQDYPWRHTEKYSDCPRKPPLDSSRWWWWIVAVSNRRIERLEYHLDGVLSASCLLRVSCLRVNSFILYVPICLELGVVHYESAVVRDCVRIPWHLC